MSLHNYRSSSFNEYLNRQSPERRRKLKEAEAAYAAGHALRLVGEQRLFNEQMQGYEEVPSGPQRARDLLSLRKDTGDWSWKPYRDRLLGENMITFMPKVGVLQERTFYGSEQAQGSLRGTTRVTEDGRIAQVHIPSEKQGRQMKTGDCPGDMGSTMKGVWDLINS